jgi:hypothetical protein
MEQTGFFLSRRKLVAGVAGIAVGAVALMASPFRAVIVAPARNLLRSQPVLRRMLLSLADAGYDEWLDQVGSTLTVAGGTSLKLVAVTPFNSIGTRPASLGRDRAFLAKFDVQNGGTMAGDLIYTAVHPQYGAFTIFLSASSDPGMAHRMTALYN